MLEHIIGKTFIDQRIDCAGKRFTRCRFDGCVLVAQRTPDMFGDYNTGAADVNVTNDCVFIGKGWPAVVAQNNWLSLKVYAPRHEPEVAAPRGICRSPVSWWNTLRGGRRCV